jgi:hypothetical protein
MRRCSPGSYLPLLVAMALATPALGQPRGSAMSGTPEPRAEAHPATEWPCQLVIDTDLKPFAMQAWERSATFRKQCGILAAANAIVIVRSASARETMRAYARITEYAGGIYANVRVRPGANAVELIAHEIEHVVERIEGVNLLLESIHKPTRVFLRAGAFETLRAVEAGRRVAQEVHESAQRR